VSLYQKGPVDHQLVNRNQAYGCFLEWSQEVLSFSRNKSHKTRKDKGTIPRARGAVNNLSQGIQGRVTHFDQGRHSRRPPVPHSLCACRHLTRLYGGLGVSTSDSCRQRRCNQCATRVQIIDRGRGHTCSSGCARHCTARASCAPPCRSNTGGAESTTHPR
jgi:hypothetical protein